MAEAGAWRLGVDVGGTFTDVVLVDDEGERFSTKVPTTDPADAGIERGIERIRRIADIPANDIKAFRHGTTVGTNALLARTGGATALITTEGFRDVLEIGRQNRQSLYDLSASRPDPLVPRRHRLEINERIPPPGHRAPEEVRRAPDHSKIRELGEALRESEVEAIAVCFLHSYADDSHERTVVDILGQMIDVPIIPSSAILPEFREYERMTTTAASAYLAPVIDRYLERLVTYAEENGIPAPDIMQSNGGIVSADQLRKNAALSVLSGPAAGVVGAKSIVTSATSADAIDCVTLDMGGTSTDVCLLEHGEANRTPETVVGNVPLRTPTVDVHTVGAGGGSIAWIDDGGALRVGPQSAGANPGPACYDRGGNQATVTDASVVLGLIGSNTKLGSTVDIKEARAVDVIGELANEGGFDTTLEAARGVFRVVNESIARAIRSITVEQGRDPRLFDLVAFGGAGGVHATDIASRLSIDTVHLPLDSGVLSADGLLKSAERYDLIRTNEVPLRSGRENEIEAVFEELQTEAQSRCSDPENALISKSIDAKYAGQSYELTVDAPYVDAEELERRFHREHGRKRGYQLEEPVHVVNCRVSLEIPARSIDAILPEDEMGGEIGDREVSLPDVGTVRATVYDGVPAEKGIITPAVVQGEHNTLVIPPGWSANRQDGVLTLVQERSS